MMAGAEGGQRLPRLQQPAPGGLHLYANYPDYQIGPLAFLVATPFRILGGGDGRVTAAIAMTAAAPVLVFLLEKTALSVWTASDERTTTISN